MNRSGFIDPEFLIGISFRILEWRVDIGAAQHSTIEIVGLSVKRRHAVVALAMTWNAVKGFLND